MWIPLWLVACSAPPAASPPAPSPPAPSTRAERAALPGLRTRIGIEGGDEHTQIEGSDVALRDLPFESWIGLPVAGRGDVAVDLRVPINHGERDFRGARGSIAFHCTGCTLGDDHSKLRTRARRGPPAEIAFGHIAFDRVDVKVVLGDGHAEITEWNIASSDVALHASGGLQLAQQLDSSAIAACLRFEATEALRARDARTHALASTTGALRGEDGMFHIQLAGTLGDMKRLAAPCDDRLASATSTTPAPRGVSVR